MSSQPRAMTSNRNSDAIRASVFDVCLQLGALDDNSLVAEWMFSDPSEDSDSLGRRNGTTRFHEVVSAGWDPVEEKVPNQRRRRYVLPFSIKAPAFTTRLRVRSRPRSGAVETTEPTNEDQSGSGIGPGHVSLSRRSFFRRSIHKPVVLEPKPDPRNATRPACDHSGRVSMNPKSFFQRKIRCEIAQPNRQETLPPNSKTNNAAAAAAPSRPVADNPSIKLTIPPQSLHDLPEDDGDEEWEEIEAIPGSPLYPLPNKGINPPALFPLNKKRHSTAGTTDTDPDTGSAEVDIIRGATHHSLSFAFPRLMFRRAPGTPPSAQKRRLGRVSPKKSRTPSPAHTPSQTPTPTPSPGRKPLSILTGKAMGKHHRGLSSSLPPSPFVLLTQNRNSTMPQPTSRIVFSDDVPVRPLSLSEAERRSMGWHNQFFVSKGEREVQTEVKAKRPKSVSVPTPLPKMMVGKGPRSRPLVVAPVPFPVMKDKGGSEPVIDRPSP